MKTIFILLFLITTSVNAQFIQFNQDEEFYLLGYVDPTVTDKGFQVGVEIRKELEWGWVGTGFSYYDLEPNYFDWVGQGGINLDIANIVTAYTGFRLGILHRDAGNQDPYALVGGIAGFYISIFNEVKAGFRFWIDYREDQKNQFYGDEQGYEKGLFTNNPLLQENLAFEVLIKLN